MSSGIEPIPVRLGFTAVLDGNLPAPMVPTDPILLEAFRQGWLSARHWPNHQLPEHLFVRMDVVHDEVILRIEWP